jgi:hypothetical protein
MGNLSVAQVNEPPTQQARPQFVSKYTKMLYDQQNKQDNEPV